MATTFVKIGNTVTVGSGGTNSIDFTSIPSTYTDLQLLLSVRTATATYQIDQIKLRFNANSSSAYAYKGGLASMAGATADNSAGTDYWWFGIAPRPQATANAFGNTSIYIPNYASSNYKPSLSESIAASNGSGDYWYLKADSIFAYDDNK